jgi:hypothetical protein
MREATPRVWSPVIDQHATWIAVNPVQGCPKGCTYCFLNQRGQTRVRPQQLATPADAVRQLLDADVYAPDRAVALYTWTDVMALPSLRSHLHDLLGEWVAAGVPNPLVLITKCPVPEETVTRLVAARAAGVPLVVYLSYSGLGSDIEQGIRHAGTVANFPALAAASIPVVHYWRPVMPQAATRDVMSGVLDLAARYARCSTVAGLKVERADVGRLAKVWPELTALPDVERAEGVYPRAFWEFTHATRTTHPGYPVFHTNACALAYVLGRPDGFGIYGGPVCRRRNLCPQPQRDRCAAAAGPLPSDDAVREALRCRGLTGTAYRLDAAARELVLDAAVPARVVGALTQDLRVRVRAREQGDDRYWSSGTAGAAPLIVG